MLIMFASQFTVVAFSTNALPTDVGDTANDDCFSSTLAFATPGNIKKVSGFIDSLIADGNMLEVDINLRT